MKICFYDSSFPKPYNWNSVSENPVGGSQLTLLNVAHGLQSLSCDVTICNRASTSIVEDVQYKNISSHSELIKFTSTQDFDVLVYAGQDREFASQYLPKTKSKKRIMWAHNGWHHHACYDNYDAIVCVSNSQRLNYAYLPIFEKTCFIHNGVNLNHFPESLLNGQKTEKAIFIGSIVPSKGLHHVVRAWPIIKTYVPKAQLLVAGSAKLYGLDQLGPLGISTTDYEENYLKPYILSRSGHIRKDIHFLGAVPHKKLGQLISSCRVALVNPNWRTSIETCCNSALEAQASGTPVVGVLQGSLPEVITDQRTGEIVRQPDDAIYAKTVASFLLSSKKSQQFGQSAREFIVNNFSLELQSQKWKKFLTAVVDDCVIPNEFKNNWYAEHRLAATAKWAARKSRLGLVARHTLDSYRKLKVI